ncbi:hypothetical protein A2707_06000 [Candidatus Saccharibacteria bacterium RIFCSPHIGHO2_01_FULL_45_15]|nr:MAG: hypothetical protein A2707_06000 [Candidatus Saccharibacteria bacterium RIFCSPHIGHO2_01_FULL_45_15]
MKRSKKQRELISFRQVFQLNDYPNIKQDDKPDFVVSHNGILFGVEVTEYYQDQTSADYANVPNYMNNILDDESMIKRKDRGKLEKVRVGFEMGGVPMYTQDAVYRQSQPIQDRLKKLNDIINAKITSMQEYKMDDLEFVELIIHDQGDLFGGESGREIYRYLSELSQSPLEGLPYRRIYISKKFGVFDEPIIFRSDMDIGD